MKLDIIHEASQHQRNVVLASAKRDKKSATAARTVLDWQILIGVSRERARTNIRLNGHHVDMSESSIFDDPAVSCE